MCTCTMYRSGNGGNVLTPRNPEKFAKDEEQLTPQPAINRDISRKFKFSLIVIKIIY